MRRWDLSYVITVCNEILEYVEKGNTIIVESTIAPMSTDNIVKPIFEEKDLLLKKIYI